MANKHTDDDSEIMAKNYYKLKGATTKIGYKDGIYDGRNSVFQDGFDMGYSQGFQNAFTIGLHQGQLAAINELDKQKLLSSDLESFTNEPYNLILNKPTRGQCQICSDPKLLNKSLKEITYIQTRNATHINDVLNRKYEPILNHFQITKKIDHTT